MLQVFVTVMAALQAAGGVRRGDRVLMHAAAGGVGLAALQVRREGAKNAKKTRAPRWYEENV